MRRTLQLVVLGCLLVGCTPAAPAPQSTPMSTASATGTGVPTSASPSATPTAPSTPLTPEQQYCADYKAITAVEADAPTDDEEMDVAALASWAGETIVKYQAASRNAPSAIAKDYRQVIQYLKDFKATIDSGNQDAIIAQVRFLPKLNAAMEAIRKSSTKLCG
jgi:hypothetical protein